MSFLVRIVLTTIAATVCAMAQPTITKVLNAASYVTPPPAASGQPANPAPIAQGSIFVVIGTGLAGSGLVQASSLPLQTNMNGVTITVTAGGQAYNAFMVNTWGLYNEVTGILPSNTPVGSATVTVTYNSQTSAPFKINVARSVPGIFTNSAFGYGPAAAQIQTSVYKPDSLTNPAGPASQVLLYATGLAPISGSDANPSGGAIAGGINVQVEVGGMQAQVIYAGRSYFPGEDQINIVLPANVPLGCYTPGVVVVDGIPSNDFTIPTGAAGSNSCAHPFGLSQSAEAALDAGGTVNLGVFSAIRGAASGLTAEGLGGLFETANATEVYETYKELLTAYSVIYFPGPIGSCVTFDELSGPPASPIPTDFTTIGSKELQPSSLLTLSGPNGVSTPVGRANTGAPGSGYLWINLPSAASPALLGPGTYTISGNAGPDIAAFNGSTQFPTNLSWTNSGNLSAPPVANGITMTWTGGGTVVQPNIWIFGNSSIYNLVDPSKDRGKTFSCVVNASLNQFAIPASITSQLPTPGTNEVEIGSLGMSTGGGSKFNATLLNGTPLDGTFFGFGEAFVNSATWK